MRVGPSGKGCAAPLEEVAERFPLPPREKVAICRPGRAMQAPYLEIPASRTMRRKFLLFLVTLQYFVIAA